MPERSRRRRIVLAVAAFALVAGALAGWYGTRPETLTSFLIGQARSRFGASLALEGPARFGFVPDLRLVLPRPSLGDPAGGAPFLRAETADVVVPWSVLWSDRIEIRSVALAKPTLDVDALDRWLAAHPSSGGLPDVRFAIRANGTRIVAGARTIASEVDIDLASAGDVTAWLRERSANPATAPLLPPLHGTLRAANVEIGGTRIEGVRVETRDDDSASATPPGTHP
ncbi:MAG TPA: hypothetical protein VHE32_06415 [Rhodanobacteraceae bacterium]|jgi:hypothetical protein|nr:hypothetical protein [Rhodanobacteraceae bacterium]